MQKLCCVHTRQQFSASLVYLVTSLPPYLHQFSTISGGNCIRLTVSSLDSQADQSNQSSIQQELLMPSPEVIDLTLSDDEIQPDPIRSDQRTSMPTRATNRFRTSSSIKTKKILNLMNKKRKRGTKIPLSKISMLKSRICLKNHHKKMVPSTYR